MSGALAGWLDVTSPISQARRTPTVTVALRHPGKGRHALEILVYAAMAAQLGWQGGVRVRVLVSPDRRRLALRPDESGKKLRDRSGSLAMSHSFDWLLEREARASEPVQHQVLDGALVLDLPDWAWPEGVTAPPPEASAITAAELNALSEDLAVRIAERRAAGSPAAHGGPRPSKMTPEREALFRRLWLDPAHTAKAVLQAVNALPGEPYETAQALYSLARRLGMPTQRPLPAGDTAAPAAHAAEPAPATSPPAAEAARPAPAAASPAPSPVAADEERDAEDAIRADPERRGARWLAEEYGWTLERAQRLVFRVRETMRAEAAAGAAA